MRLMYSELGKPAGFWQTAQKTKITEDVFLFVTYFDTSTLRYKQHGAIFISSYV